MADDFYCEICRRSDSRGAKHVYTQKHKEKIKIILRKFEDKMVHASDCISKGPTISMSEPPDQSDKFWCPFCSAEVYKHKKEGRLTTRFRNWAEHLCSLDHHKSVHNFFWRNKLDMKKRDKYKLSQGKLDEFKDVFEKAVQKYHEETQQAVREEASRIRTLEMKRVTTHEEFKVKTNGRSGRSDLILSSESAPKTSEVDSGTDCLNAAGKYNNGQTAIQGGVAAILGAYRVDPPHQPPARVMQRNRYEPSINCPTVNQIYPSQPHMNPLNQIQGVMPDGTQHALSFMPLSSDGPWELPPGPSSSAMERDPLLSSFSHPPGPSSSSAGYSRKGVTTMVKSSGGLTVISRKKSGLKGNIHTGAVPPWMRDDDEDDDDSKRGAREGSSSVIGPTEDDFKRHLEKERKRKLNPKRVGANFDHSAETSEDWLPSFGRVWNHGPRWRSRKHYRKEVGSKVKKFKK